MEKPSHDERSRRAREPATLAPETFRGQGLMPAKKLRSPVRSNESSSFAMPTPIPALVVDLKKRTTTDDNDDNNENDDDDDDKEEEVSDSVSLTTKASSQHLYNHGLPSPPRKYYLKRRKTSSISSTTTIKPPNPSKQTQNSEQKVLDAMIDELTQTLQERDQHASGYAGDDVVRDRGLQLKPARSLRRERRKARDYHEDDDDDDKRQKVGE
jgi:hypothetical protein